MKWVKASNPDTSPPQNDNYDCSTYKVPVVYLTKQGYRDISAAWADVQDGDIIWFCDAKNCDKVLFWLEDMPNWTNL